MGCDIHCHVEFDAKGYGPDNNLYARHFAKINIGRNYVLFGMLTNGQVRFDEATGIAPTPKGFRQRISRDTVESFCHLVSDTYAGQEHYDGGIYLSTEQAEEWSRDHFRNGQIRWVQRFASKDGVPQFSGSVNCPDGGGEAFSKWSLFNVDYHSLSFLTLEEMENVYEAYLAFNEDSEFGGDVMPEFAGALGAMRMLEEVGHDPYFVFCFDN